jgi:ubiquinone/menaquinone biosynthesis C-methylase UbiE
MGQPDRPTLTAGASSQWAGAGHPFFARMYARMSPAWERRGYAVRRQELLAGLAGRVVEVGAGNGLNFRHYPPEVTAVLAVEPEPYLRARAEVNARRAPIPVEVVTGTAEHIAAESAAFDAGVVSLVLCSVSDTSAALAELHRVIRPGGELRFLEHVRADSPSLRRIQRLMDASVWPRLTGGCHASRDSATAIRAAGFTIERLYRFRFPETRIPLPTTPHIVGVARRP